jgi:hypothetical protein
MIRRTLGTSIAGANSLAAAVVIPALAQPIAHHDLSYPMARTIAESRNR